MHRDKLRKWKLFIPIEKLYKLNIRLVSDKFNLKVFFAQGLKKAYSNTVTPFFLEILS